MLWKAYWDTIASSCSFRRSTIPLPCACTASAVTRITCTAWPYWIPNAFCNPKIARLRKIPWRRKFPPRIRPRAPLSICSWAGMSSATRWKICAATARPSPANVLCAAIITDSHLNPQVYRRWFIGDRSAQRQIEQREARLAEIRAEMAALQATKHRPERAAVPDPR